MIEIRPLDTPPSLARTPPSSRPALRVGVVQHRWHPDDAALHAELDEGIGRAARLGAAVVFLPELTLSRYPADTLPENRQAGTRARPGGAGATQLQQGLGSAAATPGKLQAGSGQAGAGAGKLHGGLGQAQTGAARISAGLRTALAGAQALRDGAGQALAGSKKLSGGLGQAATPVNRAFRSSSSSPPTSSRRARVSPPPAGPRRRPRAARLGAERARRHDGRQDRPAIRGDARGDPRRARQRDRDGRRARHG